MERAERIKFGRRREQQRIKLFRRNIVVARYTELKKY